MRERAPLPPPARAQRYDDDDDASIEVIVAPARDAAPRTVDTTEETTAPLTVRAVTGRSDTTMPLAATAAITSEDFVVVGGDIEAPAPATSPARRDESLVIVGSRAREDVTELVRLPDAQRMDRRLLGGLLVTTVIAIAAIVWTMRGDAEDVPDAIAAPIAGEDPAPAKTVERAVEPVLDPSMMPARSERVRTAPAEPAGASETEPARAATEDPVRTPVKPPRGEAAADVEVIERAPAKHDERAPAKHDERAPAKHDVAAVVEPAHDVTPDRAASHEPARANPATTPATTPTTPATWDPDALFLGSPP